MDNIMKEGAYGQDGYARGGANEAKRSLAAPLPELRDRLTMIRDRLDNQCTGVFEIGHKLNAHADLVYGDSDGKAPATSTARVTPVLGPNPYNGELGNLYGAADMLNDMVNRLEEAVGFMAMAAGRNSTLA